MTSLTSDPLLAIAKAIIYFLIGVILFAGFFVVLGVPAVLIFSDQVMAEMASNNVPTHTVWLVALLLACVAGMLYLAFKFFRHMLSIVNSVGEGDPFVPANADRLTAMAWLMLAINVVALPIGGLGAYIAHLAEEAPGDIEAGMDFGGIILVLTLFILARVFRKGTQMREELEGTV